MHSTLKRIIFLICTVNFAVTYVRTDWLIKCGICKCKWNSGKKTADCKNTSIVRVPIDLSTEVQVLDLSFNPHIVDLQNGEFAAAELRNLHKLYIRNCSLRSIGRDHFRGLEIVIELDLSANLLRSLPRGAFTSLVKLRALMLNNNELDRLDDGVFRNLKYLHKIELKENRLTRIESKAFVQLPVLSQIYLDGNRLKGLRRESFENLDKLTSLSLRENPWNCTCELKSFRDFAFQQNLYTPPTDCQHPPSLRGILWSDVSTNAFACKPEVLFPLAAASTVNSARENVTLSCRVHSSPNTMVTWTFNRNIVPPHPKRIIIKNVSEPADHNSMELLTSELTILGVKKSDEGTYTCVSQNAGGKTEVDILLTVQKKPTGMHQFLSGNLMLVLCLMAVGLLAASLIIMAVTCCYCHKFKKLAKQETTTIDNKKQFEAIKLNSFGAAGATTQLGHSSSSTNGDDVELEKQQQNYEASAQSSRHHNHQHHQLMMQERVHLQQHSVVQSQQHQAPLAQLPAAAGAAATPPPPPLMSPLAASVAADSHPPPPPLSMPFASHRQTGNFVHSDKSDLTGSDTFEIKCVLSGNKFLSENGTDRGQLTKNGSMSDHQQQNYMYDPDVSAIHASDARLPPDLLPYQQLLLHQNVSYDDTRMFKDNSGISSTSNHTATTTPSSAIGSGSSHRRNSSQDLHIYRDGSSGIGSSRDGNSGGSISSGPGSGNSSSYGGSHSSGGSNGIGPKQHTLPHRTTAFPMHVFAGGGGSNNGGLMESNTSSVTSSSCKPRQSIVRTSPSYSFLSPGSQQPNNFL